MDEYKYVINNESASLRLIDAQGRKVKGRNGLTNDLIFTDGSSLRSGLFIFQIEFFSIKLISGKFIRTAC